jgi:hypothetical protein
MKPYDNPGLDAAMVAAKQLKDIHNACSDGIKNAQKKTAAYLQDKRKTAPQLKEGDKVYLLTKNLKTRRPTKKLDQVKVGPFLIEEQKGPQNYQLRLPKDARIHPVFHISLLEPADKDTPLQTTFHYQDQEDNEETWYDLERICCWDGNNYLVKWKNYPDSANTWEPVENLTHCLTHLQEFHKPGNENLSVDVIKGWDKKDVDHARPDTRTRAKFVAWLRRRQATTLKAEKRRQKENNTTEVTQKDEVARIFEDNYYTCKVRWKKDPKWKKSKEPIEKLTNGWEAFKRFYSSPDWEESILKGGGETPDISTKEKFLNFINGRVRQRDEIEKRNNQAIRRQLNRRRTKNSLQNLTNWALGGPPTTANIVNLQNQLKEACSTTNRLNTGQ